MSAATRARSSTVACWGTRPTWPRRMSRPPCAVSRARCSRRSSTSRATGPRQETRTRRSRRPGCPWINGARPMPSRSGRGSMRALSSSCSGTSPTPPWTPLPRASRRSGIASRVKSWASTGSPSRTISGCCRAQAWRSTPTPSPTPSPRWRPATTCCSPSSHQRPTPHRGSSMGSSARWSPAPSPRSGWRTRRRT